MPDREKVIKGLEMCTSQGKCSPDNCTYYDRPDNASGICWDRLMTDALALLKEQDSEKERIMKVIWDALHEGFSIDTIVDQDWVYEQIRHRIEDI